MLTTVDILKVKNDVTGIINRFTIAVNVVLYIIFIIIVLVFHFDGDGSPLTCGSKYLSTPNNSTKKITTIFYAAFIAFFSLIMCLALAFFGLKFVYQARKRAKKFGTTEQQSHIKVFSIALVGGTAFLLHSLFILIQTSLHDPNIVFNFVSIIITEIIPSLYMYYNQFTYNQATQRKKRVNFILILQGS